MQPFWLRTVVRHLGALGSPLILAAREGNMVVGLVALAIDRETARFLGNPEVCDYQDMIAAPGREADLLLAACEHLARLGIRQLDLRSLRPEAAVLRALRTLPSPGMLKATLTDDAVSYQTALPDSWETYLQRLGGKQRHEVRRKHRRLSEGGPFGFRLADTQDAAIPDLAIFLELFGRNRADKAAFMTPAMTGYFQDLALLSAARRMLRLYTLHVRGQPAAAVLCFDHQSVRYLYNSAYDRNFEDLSVGVLCKLFSIQAAIAAGCRYYDFLKGAEPYKKRIGGAEVPLARCHITLA